VFLPLQCSKVAILNLAMPLPTPIGDRDVGEAKQNANSYVQKRYIIIAIRRSNHSVFFSFLLLDSKQTLANQCDFNLEIQANFFLSSMHQAAKPP
jgi:hypothetical protein